MNIIEISGHKIINILNEKSFVLDFGANTGMFSKGILEKYNCNILAYEAYKNICDEFLDKIPKDKFEYKNKAIWHTTQKVEFWNYGKKWVDKNGYNPWEGNSLFDRNDEMTIDPLGNIKTREKLKVEAIGINELLNQYEKIDYVKIDIEGAEKEVLNAVTNNNLKKCMQIGVEFHSFMNSKTKHIITEEDIQEIVNKFMKNEFLFIRDEGHPDYLFYKKVLLS